MRRVVVLACVLVGCRQLFGIQPLHDDALGPIGDGPTRDDSGDGPRDAPVEKGSDAGGDASPRDRPNDSVLCGAAGPCVVGSMTPMCCETVSSSQQTFACTATGGNQCVASPPDTTVPITCDDNTDCPSGQNCCATVDSGGALLSASCSIMPCNRVLCDPSIGCGLPNVTCMAMQGVANAPPGYYWCVTPG